MTRRRLWGPLIGVAAVAVVAVMLAVAGCAHSPGGRVGLSTHLLTETGARPGPEMKQIRGAGIDWIREDFSWQSIEPERGRFEWERTDALMAAAARSGMHVLGVLGYSAPWASSDPSGGGSIHHPPRDPADYARFARAVVERYGSGGDFWASHDE